VADEAFIAAQKAGQTDTQAKNAAADAVRSQVGDSEGTLPDRLAAAATQANSVDCAYDTANCVDCDAKTGKCGMCTNNVGCPAGQKTDCPTTWPSSDHPIDR